MKKLMAVWLAVLMICGAGLAELMNGGVRAMDMEERVVMDLDGDGTEETVYVQMVGVDVDSYLMLVVEGSDGGINIYECALWYCMGAYIVDLDGDGRMEILVSGDIASDDYFTWCLQYDLKTGIHPVPFADGRRGDNGEEYFEDGYGMVTGFEEGGVILTGSQDVLGTWMSDRSYILKDGRFEMTDDGWTMQNVIADQDAWEYAAAVVASDIEAELDGGGTTILSPGTRIVITKSDKISYACFTAEDGRKGRLALEADTQRGWGHTINGMGEETAFDFLPYWD